MKEMIIYGKNLASFVQKVDNAIHQTNHYPADKHSQAKLILSYPVNRALHSSNNWGLVLSQTF